MSRYKSSFYDRRLLVREVHILSDITEYFDRTGNVLGGGFGETDLSTELI